MLPNPENTRSYKKKVTFVEHITKADPLAVMLFYELHNLKTNKRGSQIYGGLILPFYRHIIVDRT